MAAAAVQPMEHVPAASSSAATGAEQAPLQERVSVTSDGGVAKQVLHQGHGDCPPLHARCLGARASTVNKLSLSKPDYLLKTGLLRSSLQGAPGGHRRAVL